MKLNLSKPICIFDIESTGLNVLKDRIIQLAIIKLLPGGEEREVFSELINPGPVLISAESKAIHGIDNIMIRNKPTFPEIAKRIYDFIGDSDLSGYNINRFDLPMLMEEFARAGIDFDTSKRRIVDVQVIFHKMEARTLSAAYRKFCNKTMTNAHDALADTEATLAVLEGMLDHYQNEDLHVEGGVIEKPIKNDIQLLHDFTQDSKMLDATRRLKYDSNGTVVFNFGKYIGKPVGQIVHQDNNYFHWIQEKDFSHQVKKMVKKLKEEYARGLSD